MRLENKLISRRDYILVSFIGISFALFSLPILNNINFPFLQVNFLTAILLMVFFLVFANFALWIASLIGKVVPSAFQFAKFGAAGAFNSFFDWGTLNLLIALTGIATGLGFSAFKGTSFIAASVSSYFWNKHWTFKSSEETNTKEVGKFATVTIIGFLLNIVSASLIVFAFSSKDLMSPERLANLAAFSATIIALLWNFFGYKFIVFKK